MEHFGISPIEACQLGVFPLVHDSGGVGPNLRTLSKSCVYQDIDELVFKTRALITRREFPLAEDDIVSFGNGFSVENFNEHWDALLGSQIDNRLK